MILVIPKIELSKGKCIHQVLTEFENNALYEHFADNPEEFIKLLRKENAKSVYVVDRDSLCGETINEDKIFYICANTDIPILLESNLNSKEEFDYFKSNGVSRFVINGIETISFLKENSLLSYLQNNTIVLKLTLNEIQSNFDKLIELDLNRVILNSENLKIEQITDILSRLKLGNRIRFTIYEGITNSKQLINLPNFQELGIDSIVLGDVLYSNAFPCQKMWREIESIVEKVV